MNGRRLALKIQIRSKEKQTSVEIRKSQKSLDDEIAFAHSKALSPLTGLRAFLWDVYQGFRSIRLRRIPLHPWLPSVAPNRGLSQVVDDKSVSFLDESYTHCF
jgi:hypothetical protein